MFNPSFSASDYVSDSYFSLVMSRLSWPVFLPIPVPESSVGDECGSTVHLRPASFDLISNALISLHWLRAQERVRFKTAVLMYKCTHGTAPSYLSQLVRVTDLPGRRSLSSARTNRLLIPSVKLICLPGRRTHHLEQPTGQRDICPVSVNLSSAFKNISAPGLVP